MTTHKLTSPPESYMLELIKDMSSIQSIPYLDIISLKSFTLWSFNKYLISPSLSNDISMCKTS